MEALVRLYGKLDEPPLPAWILEVRLEDVVGSEAEMGADAPVGAEAWVVRLADIERRLLSNSASQAAGSVRPMRNSVAAARLLLGAVCEAVARREARAVAPPESRRVRGGSEERLLARLYRDGALAATWTSAHAVYLQDLLSEQMSPSPPSLHSVCAEANETDHSALLERVAKRPAASGPGRKAAAWQTALLRSTTSAGRGWEAAADVALKCSDGARRAVASALVVSLTGMTSCLHPERRLHWTQRLDLGRLLMHQCGAQEIGKIFKAQQLGVREVVRRLLENSLSCSLASNAALRSLGHAVALLRPSPLGLPNTGLEASASALAAAGGLILAAPDEGVAAAMEAAFAASEWKPGYLDKMASASATPASLAVALAAEVWVSAHRALFLPLWAHAATHRLRLGRLDVSSYDSLRENNSASRLVAALPEAERLALHRQAFRCRSADVLTTEQMAGLLGVVLPAQHRAVRSATDFVRLLSAVPARDAARILCFARAASMHGQLTTFPLGAEVAEAQAAAVLRRVLAPEVPGVSAVVRAGHPDVPPHVTQLVVCLLCRRVANATSCSTCQKAAVPFTEMGCSSSMLFTNPQSGTTTLHCAKRASASLRCAMAAEETMAAERVDLFDGTELPMLAVGGSTDAGTSSRIRRDSRSTLEQRRRAIVCGDEAMVYIPLMGRVVRVFGDWHGLCCLCGAVTRVSTFDRVGGRISCMRCAYNLVSHVAAPLQLVEKVVPACRFCGRKDPQRSGAAWKRVRAPHDTSGENVDTPPRSGSCTSVRSTFARGCRRLRRLCRRACCSRT